VGRSIDIVIEDASHVSHHQQIALASLFPLLRSGGIYVIEDLQWQDESLERSDVLKTKDVLRRFQLDAVFRSWVCSAEECRYLEENIGEINLYDSLSSAFPDMTDALAVLTKR